MTLSGDRTNSSFVSVLGGSIYDLYSVSTFRGVLKVLIMCTSLNDISAKVSRQSERSTDPLPSASYPSPYSNPPHLRTLLLRWLHQAHSSLPRPHASSPNASSLPATLSKSTSKRRRYGTCFSIRRMWRTSSLCSCGPNGDAKAISRRVSGRMGITRRISMDRLRKWTRFV